MKPGRVLVCALAAPALMAVDNPAAPEPGSDFDVVRYDLALTPDLATGTVSATQRIHIRSLKNGLRTVAFSINALTIDRVTVGDRPVVVSRDAKAMLFVLPVVLDKGRSATLSVTYRGKPARGAIFSPGSVYTSYFACDWMLCLQDAPGDKAMFALDLRLPSGMESLAAGQPLRRLRSHDGFEVHRWRTARPYSPYLYGFAAGRFARATDSRNGVELTFLSEVASAPELRRRFSETRAMAGFFAAKAGVPLPAGRYAQLLVEGREAQEAATYSVIGKAELDLPADKPENDWAIAHELAHQWWGNLVTCATWRHFWLNEGITVFMTAAWKEHRFGRAAYDAELDIGRTRLARARQAGWDKPLAFAGAYPSIGIRRAIQYSKGALFMDHLRTTLGDDAFWAGFKRYTRGHAGGIVTSVDLQRAMERSSGRDLSGHFASWVYDAPTSGMPVA